MDGSIKAGDRGDVRSTSGEEAQQLFPRGLQRGLPLAKHDFVGQSRCLQAGTQPQQ